MIATVFIVIAFGIFTCWVTWVYGFGVGLVSWGSFFWGLLTYFSSQVEKGQREAHARNVEKIEQKKKEMREEGKYLVQ